MKFSGFFQFLAITAISLTAAEYVSASEHENAVSFREKSDTQLEVLIGKSTLGIFNHGPEWGKPFLFPVHAPNGRNVLRDIVATKADQGSSKEGTDHFHHKGVWVSVDSVNKERLNFWHEEDKIRCDGITYTSGSNGAGNLIIENTWMEGDSELLKEKTTITFYPSRLITYAIQLSAVDKDVTFYDTKEGFFAVRVAHTMREMEGGHIVNADGLKGEKECWGKPTPWIDYFGKVDGETCGVTLMDHPDNFRESRYHVRGYGLFSISPFGPKKYSNNKQPEAPVTVSANGDPLKLTYGLYVHDGDTAHGKVTDAYKQFVDATAK